MIDKDEIGTSGIGALFGVSKDNCAKLIDLVENFPPPVRLDGLRRVYSLRQVKAWAKTQADPAETLRQVYRDYQALHRYGDSPQTVQFNARCMAFITGQYDPAERRRERDIRLQAARSVSRPRQTVTVATEWR